MHNLADDPTMRQLLADVAEIKAHLATTSASGNGFAAKAYYSVKEVSALTAQHGVTSYVEGEIARACGDGRLPAEKSPSGHKWLVPLSSVKTILSQGLPPRVRRK